MPSCRVDLTAHPIKGAGRGIMNPLAGHRGAANVTRSPVRPDHSVPRSSCLDVWGRGAVGTPRGALSMCLRENPKLCGWCFMTCESAPGHSGLGRRAAAWLPRCCREVRRAEHRLPAEGRWMLVDPATSPEAALHGCVCWEWHSGMPGMCRGTPARTQSLLLFLLSVFLAEGFLASLTQGC